MFGQETINIAKQGDTEGLKAAMSGWVATDPSAATAMLDRLPENLAGQRDGLERSLVSSIAADNFPLATELAQRLGARDKEQGICFWREGFEAALGPERRRLVPGTPSQRTGSRVMILIVARQFVPPSYSPSECYFCQR